jgi:ketosteroid isomerase-like protein
MRKTLNFIKSAIVFAAVLTLLAVSVSCKSPEKEKEATFDKVAAIQAIDEANAIFTEAFNKGDSITAAANYATDAKFMPSNRNSVTGRPQIQTVLAGYLKGGPKLSLKTIDIWGDEKMLSEEGEWIMTDKDGKEIDRGKGISLWKMEDGKWKIFRDIFNSDMPCMPPPQKPMPTK